MEQEALAPYRPKSDETIRTEEHSTEIAKDLNILSSLNPFPANDSGWNVAGWTIPLPLKAPTVCVREKQEIGEKLQE